MSRVLVTGAAGFVGLYVSKLLLARGDEVVGLDNLNDYYDPRLKEARLAQLTGEPGFRFHRLDLADRAGMARLFDEERPETVVHMGAQAGVRYSLENPAAYVDANLVGFGNVLEGCRQTGVKHLVFASSSSVYGANTKVPFSVHDNVDHPVSFYAATKKANELMAHSLQPSLSPADHRVALLHRLRPSGTPRHGLLLVHQGDLRGQTDRRLQPRQDAARLHLHRRHRRGGGALPGHHPGAGSSVERRQSGPRNLVGALPPLQHREQPAGRVAALHRDLWSAKSARKRRNASSICRRETCSPRLPMWMTWKRRSLASGRARRSRTDWRGSWPGIGSSTASDAR